MWNVNFNFDFLDSYSNIFLNSIKSVNINNPISSFPFSYQFERNFLTLICGFKLFHFHQNFMSIRKKLWELSENAIRSNLKLLQIDRPIPSNFLISVNEIPMRNNFIRFSSINSFRCYFRKLFNMFLLTLINYTRKIAQANV